MERWAGKVAIVTGASSGIGAAIAVQLARTGMHVVGLARRTEPIVAKAAELELSQLYAKQCDMASEKDIVAAFEWTTANLGPMHVLVNNAGCNPGTGTDVLTGSVANWRQCFDLNVVGLAIAAREASKIMLAHNVSGHIVNINSDLGHVHEYVPTMSLYSASKHAVTSVSELLRQELRLKGGKHIKVTSVSPGYVATEFMSAATRNELGVSLNHVCFLSSQDVADAVVYALGTATNVHVSEITLLHSDL